jgi:hypothetical protein
LKKYIPKSFFADCKERLRTKSATVSNSDLIVIPLQKLLAVAKSTPGREWLKALPKISVSSEPLKAGDRIFLVGYGLSDMSYHEDGQFRRGYFNGRSGAWTRIDESLEHRVLMKSPNYPWLKTFSELNPKQSAAAKALISDAGVATGSMGPGDSGGPIFKMDGDQFIFAGVMIGGSMGAALIRAPVPVNDEESLEMISDDVLFLTSAAIPVSSPGFQKLLKKK